MHCPDENTILAFVRGQLDNGALARVEGHAATCPECLDLLASTARTLDSAPGDPCAPEVVFGPRRVIGSFEIVDVLDAGGMGLIYEARNVKTLERVALKRVRSLGPTMVGALRREIHALGRLEHPGVVRIIEQGTAGGVPWYAMELVEGQTMESHLDRVHRGPPPTIEDVRPIITALFRLCHTLAYVHGEGTIHRDLTPRNILIRSDGSPVLFDFGLASLRPDPGREEMDAGAIQAGTPWYIAPEQLKNELVDARADLYALGCILYETLTGRTPVPRSKKVSLVALRDAPMPPAPSLLMRDLPPEIDALISRLLAKDPRDRVGYAMDVARVLHETGMVVGSAPQGGPSARAYVYRPKLVGRGAPLAALTALIERCHAGSGGRAFVAGESGAGKTRLALELAALARRRGLRVVSGACAPAAIGDVLGAFRAVLEDMADACRECGPELTHRYFGPGGRGKVLAQCEPTLGALPGQEATPAPAPLPAEAARERLMLALEESLAVLAAERPTLIVLDDLQWADDVSISFLESLNRSFFEQHPLLIVGTYRSDEGAAELQARLAAIADQHHLLAGLEQSCTSEMVGDMLALSTLPPDLGLLLARVSGGNPFFVTEYLRMAVDEGWLTRDGAGRWRLAPRGGEALLRAEDLPTSQSIRALVDRRLSVLSAGARRLAEFAAVLGRTFDAELVAATPGMGANEIMDALAESATRHVLETAESGRVRFVHDKIREAIYDGVSREARPRLHRAAAEAVEALGGSSSEFLLLNAGTLADHWGLAGDFARELRYRIPAGDHAFRVGAYREAIRHNERAMALAPADPAQLVTLERQLADAYFGVGDMAASRRCIGALVSRAGLPMPRGRVGMVLSIVADAGASALARMISRRDRGPRPIERQTMTETARAFERLAHALYFENEPIAVACASFRALRAASRVGPSPELSRAYANLSLSLGLLPVGALARPLGIWAREVADAIGDDPARAWALELEGVYRAGLGEWSRARESFEQAMKSWEQIGDRRRWEECLTLLGMLLFQAGSIDEAASMRAQLEGIGRARGGAQTLGWALVGRAEQDLLQGDFSQALVRLDEAERLGSALRLVERIWLLGLRARAWVRSGDRERARRDLEGALGLLKGSVPTAFYVLEGYSGVVEAAMALAAGDGGDGGRARVKRALRHMRRFAFVFPIASARSRLWQGVWHARAGRIGKARREWERGVRFAREGGRALDEALIWDWVARSSAGGEGGSGVESRINVGRRI